MKEPNMAKPTAKATAFVVQTARRAISRMSTIGSLVLRSNHTKAAAKATAAAKRPRTRPDPQPQELPCDTPTSSASSASEARTAPPMSRRACQHLDVDVVAQD